VSIQGGGGALKFSFCPFHMLILCAGLRGLCTGRGLCRCPTGNKLFGKREKQKFHMLIIKAEVAYANSVCWAEGIVQGRDSEVVQQATSCLEKFPMLIHVYFEEPMFVKHTKKR
jgi:hypothetical protein